jgi:hypothetical protein
MTVLPVVPVETDLSFSGTTSFSFSLSLFFLRRCLFHSLSEEKPSDSSSSSS